MKSFDIVSLVNVLTNNDENVNYAKTVKKKY